MISVVVGLLLLAGAVGVVAYSVSLRAEWRRYLALARRINRLRRRLVNLEREMQAASAHLSRRLVERQKRERRR